MFFIETNQLVVYLTASLILIVAPGPDLIFLITQSIQQGTKAGLATALGLASGNLAHTLAAAFGITVAIQASPYAFTAIKILGACYLLYLAYLSATRPNIESNKATANPESHLNSFVRGILMNIFNPKVALFFLAFLPQFIPENTPQPNLAMIILGVLFASLVVIVFSATAILASHFKQYSILNNINSRIFNWLCATVFISLSSHLLLSNF